MNRNSEQIPDSQVAANRKQYSSAYADFAKHWEAAKLVKNLQRINPDFYPVPVVEAPTDKPLVAYDLRARDHDYLTKNELTEAHGRCGQLMHAANPFGNPIDYAFYQRSFPVWMTKIVNLLGNHKVHLFGEDGFWLVHMQEAGKGQDVSWYGFEPLE